MLCDGEALELRGSKAPSSGGGRGGAFSGGGSTNGGSMGFISPARDLGVPPRDKNVTRPVMLFSCAFDSLDSLDSRRLLGLVSVIRTSCGSGLQRRWKPVQ